MGVAQVPAAALLRQMWKSSGPWHTASDPELVEAVRKGRASLFGN